MARKRKRFSMKRSLVDIVIPVYKHIDLLKKCLGCIPDAAGNIEYKLYIHDNGSSPEEKEFYQTLPEAITVINTKEGLGYPKACNIGVKKGNSPLVMVLTQDVFLKENAIVELVKMMDDLSIGVSGMKLLFPEESKYGTPGKIQHVGIEFNIRIEPYHQFINWSADNPRALNKNRAWATTGAAFITRRDLWKQIGGFYEGYGLGTFEDVEYCTKVRKLGYNIGIAQEAVGYHMVNGTETGYPLDANYKLFKERNLNDLVYNEWRWW